jgi:hypothetical protein
MVSRFLALVPDFSSGQEIGWPGSLTAFAVVARKIITKEYEHDS